MPKISTGPVGTSIPLIEPGQYVAIATEEVFQEMNFLTYDDNGNAGEREPHDGLLYKFALLDDENVLHEVRSKPMKFYANCHPRSAMYKFFEDWLGEVPEDTADGVGEGALIQIGHDPSGQYNRVESITSVPKKLSKEIPLIKKAVKSADTVEDEKEPF